MGFSDDDVKKMREFGFLLNQKAKFDDMSIGDCAKLISYLQFYNQLAGKVEDNVMEIKRVITEPAEKSAKKSDKKS